MTAQGTTPGPRSTAGPAPAKAPTPSIRVSLRAPLTPTGPAHTSRPPEGPPGRPLLDPRGAAVVLGGADPLLDLPFAPPVPAAPLPGPGGAPAEPPMRVALVEPTPSSLFGPRGAYLFADEGPLLVADTGHHRVLGWHRRPTKDGQAADFLLGQPDYVTEARNAGGTPSALTMNVPTGIGPFGERGLFVCDAWNSRVLVWRERPRESGVPADFVLGQADFTGELPNRGGIADACGPETMHWPFQALQVGERFVVADTGNRRLLVWDTLPTETGQPADRVIGQPTAHARHDNGGDGADACSFRWPHDLAVIEGPKGPNLVVTDAGNNRVLIWDGFPAEAKTPASLILGQSDSRGVDHNQGSYWPTASALNMPYAVATLGDWIVAADTASSRLVGWNAPATTGVAAEALSAQDHFRAKGDNRWGVTTRDSLCWPYGLQLRPDVAVVVDTGNHRVLLWDLAEGIAPGTGAR
ncbi:MAG: hypothetical protein AAGH15_13740 [Myxococcota bacterium]